MLFTAEKVPDFKIGVGDQLSVFNYADNSSERCLVRPDGNITLPLVGEIVAAGRHPLELTAEIKASLARYFDKPEVTVAVQEIHSYRIFMLGKVGAQGAVESVAPLRLLQAISSAGGLSEFANEKILIIRDHDGKQVQHKVDYGKILKGSDPKGNIWLLSGDIVVAQ